MLAVTLSVRTERDILIKRTGRAEKTMTNYPQQPLAGNNPGMGEGSLSDPGIRMILSISPLDGSMRPLPADLSIQELANGSMRVSYPDGSVRELIPGADGEGRMITTLADGARIQSDLSMGVGQVTLASISSTGEKSFLSLNENGANMQRITPEGTVSNVIPESAAELVQSFREAEAFAQAEELRQDEQFNANQEFGEWNNFGKPAEWQPEQNWQPPFDPYGNGIGISSRLDQQEAQLIAPAQEFGEWNNFGKPAEWQPEQNWQPDYNFQQPQHFAPHYEQFAGGFNQPAAFMPPQGNWQPPQENWQPPAAHGFAPPPFTDASGFPVKDVSGIAFADGPQAFDGQLSNAAFSELAPEAEFGFDTSTQEQTPQ